MSLKAYCYFWQFLPQLIESIGPDFFIHAGSEIVYIVCTVILAATASLTFI